jgi:hypothetical protein
LPTCCLGCDAAAASVRPRRSGSAPGIASITTALRPTGLSNWCQRHPVGSGGERESPCLNQSRLPVGKLATSKEGKGESHALHKNNLKPVSNHSMTKAGLRALRRFMALAIGDGASSSRKPMNGNQKPSIRLPRHIALAPSVSASMMSRQSPHTRGCGPPRAHVYRVLSFIIVEKSITRAGRPARRSQASPYARSGGFSVNNRPV